MSATPASRIVVDAAGDALGARVYAPVRCLRIAALGADLAVETAHIADVVRISAIHAVARHEAGYVMMHEGDVVALADFRGAGSQGGAMAGVPALVARVYSRKFAIVVDRITGPRGEAEVYLIDVERLLGPAIEKHLLKRG